MTWTMRSCPSCNHQQPLHERCGACGFSPAYIDGFEAYAPDLAHGGGGFDASHYPRLARIEAGNFWFRARNELLRWAIQKYAPTTASFLEIGCGTGYVIAHVAKAFPTARMWGSEIFTAGLAFAARRLPTATFIQMDARHIPFQDEFDTIGAFDVLEHIADDSAVLLQVRNALKDDGVLVLTVPQHHWLWSQADEVACHVRRYAADDLHAKIEAAGFEILRSTSFVSLLLPAMHASRAGKRSGDQNPHADSGLALPSLLNRIFYGIMVVEITLIKAGLRFPVGGSRLVVARKVTRQAARHPTPAAGTAAPAPAGRGAGP